MSLPERDAVLETARDMLGRDDEDEAAQPASEQESNSRDPRVGSTVVVTTVYRRAEPSHRHHHHHHHHRREHSVRSFLGWSGRATTTNYNPSALMGGRVGFTFAERLTIGGAFYSLTARYAGPIVDDSGRELGLRMAYGGVLLAWNLYQGRVVHVALEHLAGAGAACISKSKRSFGKAHCLDKVGLVSLEPGIEVGFRVTDWARVSMAAGYRFVTREAWREPNDYTLTGPYLGLNVDVGRFDRRR